MRKTDLWDFRPGHNDTNRAVGAGNFRYHRNCTICVANTKALVNSTVKKRRDYTFSPIRQAYPFLCLSEIFLSQY